MEQQPKTSGKSISVILIVALLITSLFVGGLLGYLIKDFSDSERIVNLEEQVSTISTHLSLFEEQLNAFQSVGLAADSAMYQNFTASLANFNDQLANLQAQINALETTPQPSGQSVVDLQNALSSLQFQFSALQTKVNSLEQTVANLPQTPITYQNITYVTGYNVSLSQLFEQVKSSVVVIQGLLRQTDLFGRVYYSTIQGSGFIYNYSGRMVALTNNHVVNGALNITVTFTTGKIYSATVLGTNPDHDFAVLTTNAPPNSYRPLEIVSSATLKVGDPVIVVGTPYGLAGSMSNGIVSALNRTLTTSSQTTITNVIQTTAPLNPGNSGGPLMNYYGQVVGIATAIIEESQGIGFAVPSDSILPDIQRLVT